MTESPALPTFDISFDPVPVAARHDGWTREKQRGFIDALAACGCVKAAAEHVGMTAKSAYRLRNRPDAAGFAAVWDRAINEGVNRTRDDAFARAIYGERVPHYYGGRLVGTHVRYNDRLLLAVLKHDMVRRGRNASPTEYNGWTEFCGDVP